SGCSPAVVISTNHPLSDITVPHVSRSVPRLALTLSTSSPTRTTTVSFTSATSKNLMTTGTISLPTTPRGGSGGVSCGLLKVFPRPLPAPNPCDLPPTVTTSFY
ncbi:hypothetical protein PMAYCL1PPCAC_00438, partial [Pristionchus mayeri]